MTVSDTTTMALSDGYWNSVGHSSGAIVSYAVLGLVLMLLGFAVLDLATPGSLRTLVREGKPNAVAISTAGNFGVALIVVFTILGSGGHLAEGLIAAGLYGLIGIVALVLSGRVVDRVLGIDVGELLTSSRFRPQSLVVAGAHLAFGLVIGVSLL